MTFGPNFHRTFIKNALSKFKFDHAATQMRSSNIIHKTLLEHNQRLSDKFNCNLYLKREDLQSVRSFKIRGAYNKIMKSIEQNKWTSQDKVVWRPGKKKSPTVVTVSAGNHAQGVSLTCSSLNLNHHIFLPENTPLQKVNRIKYYGRDKLTLHLKGSNFDESLFAANQFCKENESIFVHPFDDEDVIIGQGTIGNEIYDEIKPDMIILPIGGGGLISGVGQYSKIMNKDCLIYGVEPKNADSMTQSLKNKEITTIEDIDTFVDGASVKTAGKKTFEICSDVVDNTFIIDNNHLSYNMIDVYQNEGIVLEPAGALSISCLDKIDKSKLKGKNVVCVLSGGNNDISRYPDIVEKALLHQDLKHYFLITFGQTPGELKKYINNVLGPSDDITRFEYLKRNNKNHGAVLLGIELQQKEDINNIISKMKENGFKYTKINPDDLLYSHLI
jgi:threonine dehydratase